METHDQTARHLQDIRSVAERTSCHLGETGGKAFSLAGRREASLENLALGLLLLGHQIERKPSLFQRALTSNNKSAKILLGHRQHSAAKMSAGNVLLHHDFGACFK